MKSIEAIDANTVKFTVCDPDPALPYKVTTSAFAILQKDVLEKTGGDAKKINDMAIGTGPYKLKEWKRGDSLTFEANSDWWGGALKNKGLVLRWSKEAAQALLELKSGNADGIEKVATEDFDAVKKDAKLKLVPVEPLNIMYVGFQVDKAPFNNEKVRQAFAMALDRKKIVDDYYPAGSLVATNFVPPSFKPGASPNIPWSDFDAKKAKALLDEAKFDFNQEVPLSYREVVRVYLPSPAKVAQEIQAQLKQIGVKVKLTPKESGTFIKSASAGEEPFYLLGWGADYPDATNFFDYHFGTGSKQFGKPFPDILEQIKIGATNSDGAKRQAAYDKLNELLKTHVPMIPVAHGYSAQAFQASVDGAHANPLTPNEYSKMKGAKDTFVYVQAAEPISLDCADESDGETFSACGQIYEQLLGFKPGTVELAPQLATEYKANPDATEWTFTLRKGVKFTNGAVLDANDVVLSFARMWDASHPLHKGDTGTFEYWSGYFGDFLNAKK
jgi:ABC-type transport system substrate-binding protein